MESLQIEEIVNSLEVALEEGLWEEASIVAHELIKEHIELAAAYNALAIISIEADQDFLAAKAYYEQALEHEPDSATLCYNIAILCDEYLNQTEEAVAWFNKAIALNELFVDAYVHLTELLMESSQQMELALSYAKKVELIEPEHARNLNNIGCLYMKQLKNVDEAITYFKKALQLTNQKALIAANLADAYVKTEAYEEAKKMYKLALNYDPSNSLVSHNFAYVMHHHFKELESAKMLYERAIMLNPQNIHPYLSLKNLYLQDYKQPKSAVAILEKAMGAMGEQVNVLLELADLYDIHLEDYDKAIDYYNRVLVHQPYHATALNALAYIQASIYKNYDEAIACYELILEVDPMNPITYVNIGHVYFLKLSDFERALVAYKSAKELIETHDLKVNYASELYFNMGLIYENYLSDPRLAMMYYEMAVGLKGYKKAEQKLLAMYQKGLKVIH